MTAAGVSGSSRATASSTRPAICSVMCSRSSGEPASADGSALSTRENYNDLMPEARTPQTRTHHHHAHPRRRHRPGSHRSGPPHPGGQPACRSTGIGTTPASSRSSGRAQRCRVELHRVDSAEQGRAQGPGDDADRRGVHERQRRPAQGARPVREPAPGLEPAGRPVALPGRRPGDRAREHRGPVRRPRARGRARRRREPEDHHRARFDADRRVRLRPRAPPRPQEGHGHPQGEHHEARATACSSRACARSRASTRTSSTTRRSSTPRACSW